MIIIAISSIVLCLIATVGFFYFRRRYIHALAVIAETQNEVMRMRDEQVEAKAFADHIMENMVSHIEALESTINSQLIARSSEVGSPPPSGAYHALFSSTGGGKALAVYICLDTGHVARWHFNSADALEMEGKRFIRAAQNLRDGILPDVPTMSNIPIGGSRAIH